MQVPLDNILFSGEYRARTDYGDLQSLVRSLMEHGQLQPVVVRETDPEAGAVDKKARLEDRDFILVDGGRRFAAVQVAWRKDLSIPELPEDHIEAMLREDVDPLKGKILEFRANEDRKDFHWREKAKHVREVHEALKEKHAETEERAKWSQKNTAEVLNITQTTVARYLQLTEDEEIWNHKKLKEAESWRTAKKHYDRLREKQKRQLESQAAQSHKDRLAELKEETGMAEVSEDMVDELAEGGPEESDEVRERKESKSREGGIGDLVTCDDARHWFTDYPDAHFDWVHWDPPYGGGQEGGAHARFKGIADDWQSASQLMREGIPEVYRLLKDGHWLVIWCHPARVNWLQTYLRGHQRDREKNQCQHCGVPWEPDKLEDPCYENPDWRFWVNPYPNIWHKHDRTSDGSGIKRYLVNQYETFLLASKAETEETSILPGDTQRPNVFKAPMPDPEERRHQMHKPAGLLREVIELISVEGSLGADPSAGGGSIIEAAFHAGRKIQVCEIDEEFADECEYIAQKTIKELT